MAKFYDEKYKQSNVLYEKKQLVFHGLIDGHTQYQRTGRRTNQQNSHKRTDSLQSFSFLILKGDPNYRIMHIAFIIHLFKCCIHIMC